LKIVHRDIKPENILVDSNYQIKLIDFNVSRKFNFGRLLTVTGTPEYNAPEIINGEEYSEKVDVWSAGLCLYQMVAGTLPVSHP